MFEKKANWLVVLTILKNISQWEGLSRILLKKKMFETTNQQTMVKHLFQKFQVPIHGSYTIEKHVRWSYCISPYTLNIIWVRQFHKPSPKSPFLYIGAMVIPFPGKWVVYLWHCFTMGFTYDGSLVPGDTWPLHLVLLLVEGLKDPLNVLRRDADAWTVTRPVGRLKKYLWVSGSHSRHQWEIFFGSDLMEVRVYVPHVWPYELWGYSLKFRPEK